MNTLQHVAIIMDGNGRWAKKQGKSRTAGHKKGVETVRDIAIHASESGISCLTLYAFSTENWKRPEKEVNYIMSLPKVFFAKYLEELMANNIRVTMIGEEKRIPKEALGIFKQAIRKTRRNTGMTLNFAVNYGGRDEIVRAARSLAKDYKSGLISRIDENVFESYLDTSGLPEIDLLIRTSNELRLSNFLLYQLAYSEMIFTETLWPDFTAEEFDRCIEEYQRRKRNFGGIDETEDH